MEPRPDLLPSEWLEAFSAFATHLNFTRAARALHLSQPALHERIRRLGEALDVALYRHRGRQLELTDAGRTLAAFAREQSDRTRSLRDQLSARKPDAPFVIAAGEGTYLHVLGPAIARLRAPLRLLVHNREQAIEAVLTGDAHVGVASLDAPVEGLTLYTLREVPTVIALPRTHPLANEPSLTVRALDGARLVVPPRNRPHRTVIDAAFRTANARFEPAAEVHGWTLMLHFAQLGLGLAIVNGTCAMPPTMIAVPLTDLPRVRYHAFVRDNSPARDELTQLLAAFAS